MQAARDFYAELASGMFSVELGSVTREQRREVKAATYRHLYSERSTIGEASDLRNSNTISNIRSECSDL